MAQSEIQVRWKPCIAKLQGNCHTGLLYYG